MTEESKKEEAKVEDELTDRIAKVVALDADGNVLIESTEYIVVLGVTKERREIEGGDEVCFQMNTGTSITSLETGAALVGAMDDRLMDIRISLVSHASEAIGMLKAALAQSKEEAGIKDEEEETSDEDSESGSADSNPSA